jgi:hypothetical protein
MLTLGTVRVLFLFISGVQDSRLLIVKLAEQVVGLAQFDRVVTMHGFQDPNIVGVTFFSVNNCPIILSLENYPS